MAVLTLLAHLNHLQGLEGLLFLIDFVNCILDWILELFHFLFLLAEETFLDGYRKLHAYEDENIKGDSEGYGYRGCSGWSISHSCLLDDKTGGQKYENEHL